MEVNSSEMNSIAAHGATIRISRRGVLRNEGTYAKFNLKNNPKSDEAANQADSTPPFCRNEAASLLWGE